MFRLFRCEVVGEEVSTPICVTVTDQEVDEFCEDVKPDAKCYHKRCTPGFKTVYDKGSELRTLQTLIS
jgi:hypothetical protein